MTAIVYDNFACQQPLDPAYCSELPMRCSAQPNIQLQMGSERTGVQLFLQLAVDTQGIKYTT